MNKDDFLKAKEDYVGLLMQGDSNKINIYIEGKDDYNFYYQFFKHVKPNLIRCYRKSNVLKVAKLHNKIGSYRCVFFVDKDFDANEEIANVFITNFYNYESHIFSKNNVAIYLKEKHSLCKSDIDTLMDFLNSESLLEIFHSEYERIKLHDGEAENKLINSQLNKIQVDENYDFESSNLYTKKISPVLETQVLEKIEMYNGKHIGNLLFGVFQNTWFERKFNPDMKIKDRKQLHNDMIIHCESPEYVKNALIQINEPF